MGILLAILAGEALGGIIAFLLIVGGAYLILADYIVEILAVIGYVIFGITCAVSLFLAILEREAKPLIVFAVGVLGIFGIFFRDDVEYAIWDMRVATCRTFVTIENRSENEEINGVYVYFEGDKYAKRIRTEKEYKVYTIFPVKNIYNAPNTERFPLFGKKAKDKFFINIETYSKNNGETILRSVNFNKKWIYPNGTKEIFMHYDGEALILDSEDVTVDEQTSKWKLKKTD